MMSPSKQTAFANDKVEVVNPILFWKEQLDSSALLEIPADFPRSSVTAAQIDHFSFSLSPDKLQAIKHVSRQYGTSLFSTLLAVYNTLLFRYTKQENIIIGVPTIENLFNEGGELVDIRNNTKVFQTSLTADTNFNELVRRVHQVVLIGNKYRAVSFEKLEAAVRGELGHNYKGLYNVVFSFSDTWLGNNKFDDWVSNVCVPENSRSTIELALYAQETNEGLKCALTYNAALFEPQTIQRLASHFEVLLDAIIDNAEQTLGELPLLTMAERFRLTNGWNISKVDYPGDQCIFELFEKNVNDIPNKPALVFENQSLTYAELNDRANQVAHYLGSLGVGAETLVPLLIGRSLEMIIGMWGILKAGAAYVPIDPNYPAERIAYMLEDTNATVVICNIESKPLLSAFPNIESVELGSTGTAISNQPINNPDVKVSARNLAYVIYTSGSTGKPKGVMIEHRSLIDHCFGVIESAGLNDCESFALFSPLVFDAGHSMIHSSFILGSCLHVLSEEAILSSEKIKAYLDNNIIDCIKIVPSLWLSYANLQSIVLSKKVMIFGGEAFHLGVLNYLKNLNYSGNVYNHYGPTEITIGKCIYHVNIAKSYRSVPIGKPFSNAQLYVLDENFQLTPIGIEGELYVAGDGVARGYLKQPGLTAEKFIRNLFSEDSTDRMYRTGDKVKWLPDGNIEYLGRADEQVKILGHRIELGEIEGALLKSDLVKQAVVLAIADKNGNKRLVGYVVPTQKFNKEMLTLLLRKSLPEYMIPVAWIELENIPVTKNGKADKKILEGLSLEVIAKKYVGARTEVQIELVSIWQEVLKVDKIGIEDDFFELGGNSILAVLLFAKIKRKFNKTFPLAAIFRARTISLLAESLRETAASVSFSSSLVAIQPNGTKTPIFGVHAGLGDILFYESLSKRLGSDQPFYGIQAKGITGTELPSTQMEQMAEYYLNEIRKIQAEGPYYLAGYCLGSRVVFEMAQQLIQNGEKVALLANFNGISPTYPEQVTLTKPLLVHLRSVIKLPIQKKLPYISNEFKREFLRGSLFPIGFRIVKGTSRACLFIRRRIPLFIAKISVNQSLFLLQSRYEPKPYQGSMVVFRSPGIYNDPYLGWKDFVKQGIRTFDIPGDHENRRDILNEPFVGALAEKLKYFLEND